jgi:hypothetical protein
MHQHTLELLASDAEVFEIDDDLSNLGQIAHDL